MPTWLLALLIPDPQTPTDPRRRLALLRRFSNVTSFTAPRRPARRQIFYTSFTSLSQAFPAMLPPPQLRPLPPPPLTTTTMTTMSAPPVPLGSNIPVYHNIASLISPRMPDFNELYIYRAIYIKSY